MAPLAGQALAGGALAGGRGVSLKAHLAAPRGQFLSTAMTALVPLLVIWWLGAGVMIDLLRPGANLKAHRS